MPRPSHVVPPVPSGAQRSTARRVLAEGACLAREAARLAGLAEEVTPSNKTFLRALVSGKLEGIKIGGRWLTSPGAVLRWIEASQERRVALAPSLTSEDADAVLAAHGLAREATS